MDPMIEATIVNDEDRMDFLPDNFGGAMMRVEDGVYGHMGQLCEDYKGGYCDLIELSNGGAYMRLRTTSPRELQVVAPNGYYGRMSEDAFGITACLYAINWALAKDPDNEQLYDKFYQLRNYALEHAEMEEILAAID